MCGQSVDGHLGECDHTMAGVCLRWSDLRRCAWQEHQLLLHLDRAAEKVDMTDLEAEALALP